MKLFLKLLLLLPSLLALGSSSSFDFREATIDRIRLAFSLDSLTSHHLVTSYLHQIHSLNPFLRAVIEVNPDALEQASASDRERLEARRNGREHHLGPLHGIPVLLKDSIGTLDGMNTTCGSYALLGAKVAGDAHVVERLRAEGAVLLGKASLSEWYHMRSFENPNGWSARGGQGVNPYVSSADPCGSSSGSAIAVAANMVTVSLGSETHSSIICPSDHNSVVGFKPTTGLTSRAGIIPVSPRVDSIGPITRTVADAVYVLDAIVGVDPRDEATIEVNKFVPAGGYRQFLKEDSLRGKRLGVVRNPFFASFNGTAVVYTFEQHLVSLRGRGAIVIDNLEIENVDIILDPHRSGEMIVMLAEFRRYLNEFLVELRSSPVRSLADIIAFNIDHPDMEMTEQYSQDGLIEAEAAKWDEKELTKAKEMMRKLSEEGFEKLMKENELDAMVTIGVEAVGVMAMEGYPAITVPAGYDDKGMPFGMFFGGLKGSEPKLIEIAYGFEQVTMARRPPSSCSLGTYGYGWLQLHESTDGNESLPDERNANFV